MSNVPEARLGDAFRRGQPIAALLRSIGIKASVKQVGTRKYHVTPTLDTGADRLLSAHWYLALIDLTLDNCKVTEAYQMRADWEPGSRVIGVDFYLEGEPKLKATWLKAGSGMESKNTAKQRIEVNVCETKPQPVPVFFADDVCPGPSPTLYAWPPTFWFVRGGWPLFLPSASPYRM